MGGSVKGTRWMMGSIFWCGDPGNGQMDPPKLYKKLRDPDKNRGAGNSLCFVRPPNMIYI